MALRQPCLSNRPTASIRVSCRRWMRSLRYKGVHSDAVSCRSLPRCGKVVSYFLNTIRSSTTGLEGIVSKRRDSPYRRGRSPDWLKLKCIIFCTEGARPHCGCKSVVAFKPAVGGFGAEAGRSAYDRRPACIIINGFCCRLVCLLRSADYRGVIMKKLTRERLFGGPKKAHKARARLARARFVIVAARERAAEVAQQSAGRPVTLRPTVLQRRRLADRLKAKSIRSAFLLRRPWMDGAASQPVRQ
jgi:hypothetical protein